MKEELQENLQEDWKQEWKQLNSYQLDAVLDESPACVVNANVGSGKTTVLIEKILYLHFQKRVPLEEMVVLTFTNKAAGEIAERLVKKEPSITREQVQYFGTFHSVALCLLKEKLPVEELGFTKDFTVIDPEEEADLALEIIAERKLNVKYKNRLKKRLEQEYRSYLQGKENSRQKDDLFLLYPLLEEEKKKQNKMSFSDLLRISISLLKRESVYPSWIIVDEVQDSDGLQMEFLEALKGNETKLFAVGDPNQVIYSWRGTVQNTFYLLKQQFEAKELSLPINYRSNASILEAANRFLQFGNKIQGAREAESKIIIKKHYDPFQEAEYLSERICELHAGGLAYSEIAVFYRLQKQSDILEKVFSKNEIPYQVSIRKTIKDIPVLNWFIKVLRFSCNPADVQMGIEALTDANYGEKCTKKKAKELLENAQTKTKDISKKTENMPEQKKETSQKSKAGGLYWKMTKFAQKEEWRSADIPLEEEIFAYFGLNEALHPTTSSYAEDERTILEFLRKLCDYCKTEKCFFIEGTRDFVNSSALYGMNLFEKEPDGECDAVRLMTLHASKGLEFDHVFLIGANQGMLPLHSQGFEMEEEECRLFFVGITRARNKLEISYYTNPGERGVLSECSRYLRRIPAHLVEWEDHPSDEQRRSNLQQLRREVQEQLREKAEEKDVKRARHPKYGEGILISEDEMMVEVEFEGYGRKQFLKAFGEVDICK
ncbi:MAG: ATP-dependent helicase [Lachnospiraceae bacterium]|nr:ATP-dependent helicase [Lachnospiraceae bacterium]